MLVLGVIFEVAATMVGTVGKQLVSYSGRVESKRRSHVLKVAGLFVTTLIGPVLDMAAYAFAPQAIIAPLNGLDIVWNTGSAPFTLGEKLSCRHVVGSALVFIGAMMTSVLGPHHSQQETLAWVQETFLTLRFVFYMATFGGLLFASAVVLRTRPKGVGDKARGVALGVTAGGIAGNMYFISAGLGMLRSSGDTGDWSAWANWLPYVVLVCGILVAVSNIPFMTKALQEYEAIFVVTLFEGSHIVVACVSGAWVLGEMDNEEPIRRCCYWLCVLIIVAGLLIIQSTAQGSQRLEEGEDGKPFSQPSDMEMQCTESERPLVANGEDNPDFNVVHAPWSTSDSGVVMWAGGMSGIGSANFASADTDDDSNDDVSEDSTGAEARRS